MLDSDKWLTGLHMVDDILNLKINFTIIIIKIIYGYKKFF